MNSKALRTKSLTISRDHIVSQVTALLYAIQAIPDNCDVKDIIFYEPEGDQVPIDVIFKKDLEVRAFKRKNGQGT